MELNTKGRYAVMAMADLAQYGADETVALSAISDRQQISLAYLEQLFAQLRRANIVDSRRGRSGGYSLARTADKISIAEIMSAVGEPVQMTRCSDDAGFCHGEHKCLTHDLWRSLGTHILSFLSDVTLLDVLEKNVPLWPVTGPKPNSKSEPESESEPETTPETMQEPQTEPEPKTEPDAKPVDAKPVDAVTENVRS